MALSLAEREQIERQIEEIRAEWNELQWEIHMKKQNGLHFVRIVRDKINVSSRQANELSRLLLEAERFLHGKDHWSHNSDWKLRTLSIDETRLQTWILRLRTSLGKVKQLTQTSEERERQYNTHLQKLNMDLIAHDSCELFLTLSK